MRVPRNSTRNELLVIGTLIGAAPLIGVFIARYGATGAALLLGTMCSAILAYLGAFAILMILVAISPFVVGRTISMGGLPDLSAERALLGLGLVVAGWQWLTRGPAPRIAIEDMLIGFFTCWALLTMIVWNPVNLSSQLQLFTVYALPFLAYLILTSSLDSPARLQKLLAIPLPVIIILSIVAPVEFVTGRSVVGATSEVVAGAVRVQSFLRSSWEFAATGNMFLALCIPSLREGASCRWKSLALVALLLGSLAVTLSFLRASWIELAIVMAVVYWQIRRLRLPMVVVAVGAVVALLILVPSFRTGRLWTERVVETENIQGRLAVLPQQLALFQRSPLVGVGLAWLTTTHFAFGGDAEASSHNTYLGHLVSFGLVGLVYYGAILTILGKSLKTYRLLPKGELVGKELVAGLWAAAAVFLIESGSVEVRFLGVINVLFWIVLGVLVVLRRQVDLQRPLPLPNTTVELRQQTVSSGISRRPLVE